MEVALGSSSMTASPQFVPPSQGPLPVATKRSPVVVSTTAPARPQMAESLPRHDDGSRSAAWSPEKLSDEAIFSRAGSRVMAVVQTTWPSATASFWIWPSGEAAYTAVRSGSATGVAVVVWYDAAERALPAGGSRRQRHAVGRLDGDHVVERAVPLPAVEVDRRGVHRAVEAHLLAHQ